MASKRNPEEVTALMEQWFDEWSDFMGLKSIWLITVNYVEPKKLEDRMSMAETSWPPAYRHATINMNRDCLFKHEHTDMEMEQTVMHELGHLVLSNLWDLPCTYLAGPWRTLFTEACETAVDIYVNSLIRMKYAEDRCDRHCELHAGSDDNTGESVEESVGETGGSGRVIREPSTTTTRGISGGWDRNSDILMDYPSVPARPHIQGSERGQGASHHAPVAGCRRYCPFLI